ncbi:MAG: hypothetical protein ACRCZ0_04105 [Cetobacterium sp.]
MPQLNSVGSVSEAIDAAVNQVGYACNCGIIEKSISVFKKLIFSLVY